MRAKARRRLKPAPQPYGIFKKAVPARRSECIYPNEKNNLLVPRFGCAHVGAKSPPARHAGVLQRINTLPTRQFGQPTLLNPPNTSAPNLVQGEELFNPTAIAFDTSASPYHVYVVDTGNNRVLGWSNINSLNQGNFADLVLGQPASAAGGFDFTSTLQWGPGTNNSAGLFQPSGQRWDRGRLFR